MVFPYAFFLSRNGKEVSLSRTYHNGERKIRVRGIRRKTDTRRLARALIEMEYQRAKEEAQAQAEHQAQKPKQQRSRKGKP